MQVWMQLQRYKENSKKARFKAKMFYFHIPPIAMTYFSTFK